MRCLISSIFVLVFCVGIVAQTDKPSPCPIVDVIGPAGVTISGETMTFTANVNSDDDASLIYSWTVSDGTISEGQGTPIIKVITTTEPSEKEYITATVEVKGLPENCANKASERSVVAIGCRLPITFDEYGKMPFREEKARLANLAFELKKNTDFAALIIIYLAKEDTYSSVKNRVNNVSNYLTENQQIPKERFKFLFSEFDTQKTVIYTLPPSAIDNFSDGEKSLTDLRSPNQTSSKTIQKNQKRR